MSRRKEYIEQEKVKLNYTTIFLLPMLGFNKDFYPNEFISSYLIDVTKPKLALCFENTDSEDLKECIQVLQNHVEFESMNYDDDEKEVVVILSIPEVHKSNYNNFKIGRYTLFDENYKEELMDVHGRVSGNGKAIMMIDAVHPSFQAKKFRAEKSGCDIKDLPNGEVMSIPDMDLELYCTTKELTKEKAKRLYGIK